jgi:hypothetical protein
MIKKGNLFIDTLNNIQPFRDTLFKYLIPEDIDNIIEATYSQVILSRMERVHYMSVMKLLPKYLASISKFLRNNGEVYIVGHNLDKLQDILNSYTDAIDDLKDPISLLIIASDNSTREIKFDDGDIYIHNIPRGLKSIIHDTINNLDIYIVMFDKDLNEEVCTTSKEVNNIHPLILLNADKYKRNKSEFVYCTNIYYICLHNNPMLIRQTKYTVLNRNKDIHQNYVYLTCCGIHINLGNCASSLTLN